jgi:hypothetical protein
MTGMLDNFGGRQHHARETITPAGQSPESNGNLARHTTTQQPGE